MRRVWIAVLILSVASLAFAANAPEPCRVSERTINGVRQVLLENAWVRLVVEPEKGGRIAQFHAKKSKLELARPKYGITNDRFWNVTHKDNPWKGAYEAVFRTRSATRSVMSTNCWDRCVRRWIVSL